MRRGVLKAMLAMTIPGLGGQSPRTLGAPQGQATPVGVQAGVSAGVDFARVVVVYGPSGAVNGVFVYQPGTTPKSGNGPVLSGTLSSKDLYGNTVQEGWVSYASPGSGTYAELLNAHLALNFAGMSSPAEVLMTAAGQISILSGDTAAGDSPGAVSVSSKNANGGARLVSLVADQVQLDVSASQNIPLAAVSGMPLSGSATLAQVITAVNAIYAALVTAGVFA
jgi:hypothetical protein